MILRRLRYHIRMFNGNINKFADKNEVRYSTYGTTGMKDGEKEPPADVTNGDHVVSKAMKSYLERAKEHSTFMRVKTDEYKIGKRHLANMMGEDPETFTQDDVDKAIEYLFPSGLYEKRARPMMKPPEEIYPKRKAAEFDVMGRPHHFLFYTGRANFYKLLFDTVEHINELNAFEDAMRRKNGLPDPNLLISTSGYKWLNKDELEQLLVEPLTDLEYEQFVKAMEKLISLPYSYRAKEFISKYRQSLLGSRKKGDEIAEPKLDADGRAYVTVYECVRKSAKGDVTVRSPGTGKITINGQGLDYFDNTQSREQLLFPLIFTGLYGKVDVDCNVQGGGTSSQAGAIRWGIATALRSFVEDDFVEKMRLAGLLTRDVRRRERKKPGQEGARRKFTWKKR